MIALVLTVALLQSPTPERTVALVFRDRTVIVRLSEAESQYATLLRNPEQDHALFAALTLALGTIPDHRIHEPQLTPQERERFRWHRRPLQGSK